MLFEEVAISARDEVDYVVGVGGERRDGMSSAVSRNSLGWHFDNWRQGSLRISGIRNKAPITYIVIEEKQTLLSRLVFAL